MFIRLPFRLPLIALIYFLAEIFANLWLAEQIGWWLLLVHSISMFLGIRLLRTCPIRHLQQMARTNKPLRVLIALAGHLIAALLFIIPGPISHLLGIVLLMRTTSKRPPQTEQQEHTPTTIEGECRHISPTPPTDNSKNQRDN